MNRLLSSLVVLAHLCVISTPCFDADADLDGLLIATVNVSRVASVEPVSLDGRTPSAPSPLAVAPARMAEPDPHRGHHGHHGQDASPPPVAAVDGHPSPAPEAAHAHHHAGHQSEPATVSKPWPEPAVADLQLRAPCMCGCGEGANSAGTTTSPRIGFALLSPDPQRLPEVTHSFGWPTVDRVPVPLSDAFDHVPIFS